MTTELNPDSLGDSPATAAPEITVGRIILRLGDAAGAALREATRLERAHIRPRPAPILIRPRLIRGLVDRRTEVAAALSGLDAGIPVELSGAPGIGKTAVLRHLAHHPRAGGFADGVVYVSAGQQSSTDLLQHLFDAFYDRDANCKPTDAEIRLGLQDKHALILLDAVSLPPNELAAVVDYAPRCAFVVGTRERCLWGEVRALVLTGLPVDDAVVLLERGIERSLDATERPAAESLCAALGGHPLRIEQAAALIRDRGIPADAWAQQVTAESVIADLMTSIDEKQRRILLVLAALPGVPIPLPHVSGIAELTDIEPSLMRLVGLGLVRCVQSRYHLADGVGDRLRRTELLTPWVNRAITYFTAWAERHRRRPENLLDAADALLRVQQHATEARRSGEVLRLGRLLEAPLVVSARWGAWDLSLERCLAAARAIGDRSVEAWALHEMGTRAVCLGEADNARRLLGQAAGLRESLGEHAAATISRRNLGFVRAHPSSDARERVPVPVEQAWDLGSMPVRDARVYSSPRARRTTGIGVLIVVMLVCAIVGGVVYGRLSGRFTWGSPRNESIQQPRSKAPVAYTEVTPQTPSASAEPSTEQAPDAPAPERANILIFTARPGSIATTRRTSLCYAVNDASQARIEPGIGEVDPAATLTCRRVAPVRTTTYQLSAVGRDGVPVSQQLVIVVR
jgi:hypothetical protein